MGNIVFKPPPGLFTDDTTFTSDGKWIEGSNVAPRNGQMEVIGGWRSRTAQLGGGITATSPCSAILEWKTNAGVAHVAYGFTNRLLVEKADTLYNITPTGTFSGAKWVFQTWGETLLALHVGGKLYQWSLNTGTAAQEITQAPDNITTILVTQERQCLALGCNEEGSGTFNPRCIRGCDLEDLTDWTTTTTNNAFEHILDGSAGGVVSARLIASTVAVWTESELWHGQFLGNPGQTYSFERQGSNCGAVGGRATIVANERAFWLAPDLQFHTWAPGEQPTEIVCPLINYFRAQIDTADKVDTFACHIDKFDEVWFHYPKVAGGVYRGRYVAFSINTGLWFKGETERRVMHQGLSNIIAVLGNGTLSNCETGQYGQGNSVVFLSWSLESADYYLDKGNRRVMLKSVWPDFGASAAAGNISLVLKTSEYPQGTETSQPALTLTGSTTKKDFLASGRMIRVVLSGSDGDGADTATFMRFGSLTFDTEPLGKR